MGRAEHRNLIGGGARPKSPKEGARDPVHPGLQDVGPGPAAPLPPDFETGVLTFLDALRSFIRRRVGNPADVDDLSQEVVLKVLRARGTLRDPRRLQAWVYRTARHAIIDHYRRQRATVEVPEDLPADPAAFDEAGDCLRRSVRLFLDTLPEAHRLPLLRAEFDGRSATEIARELGLTVSAAKSRLARGRALLRTRLLACCRFEFDRFGRAIDYERRRPCGCDDQACRADDETRSAAGNAKAPPVRIVAARQSDNRAIIALLDSAGLPTVDLASGKHAVRFLAAKSGRQLVGCAGVEVLGRHGLLRSVAVLPTHRGLGTGRRLVERIQALARARGAQELFLLTTAAETFFDWLGYRTVEREAVPPDVRDTSEFRSLCPGSALVMRKRLALKAGGLVLRRSGFVTCGNTG